MDNIDDQFSLKWNNFQSNLATGFHDLLQEEMMVDVTLAAEGKFLQAHKIILSVCSPYFKDLFKVNPCKHPIVILKDVGHQEMADMLDFMYRGEANVRQEDLAAFLKLAETLKVKGLAGDKQGEDETPPPSSQAPRKSAAPQQVPKKKKIIETSVFESDDHDPGDSDYNPGGGEPRRKKRRSSPPPKTETVMPSASSSTSAQPFPLANPKQEMPDPEEIQLIDDNDEANDPLVQLISGQGTKQEHDQQDFDDSNFDNTLEDTGDGSHETDFDMSAGPSGNPDESTDQVPQDDIKPDILMLYDAFTDFNYDPNVYFAQNGNPGQSEILPVPTKRRRGRPRKQFTENRPVIVQQVQPVRPASTTGRSLRSREKPKENKIEILPKVVQVPPPGPRGRGRPRKNIENAPVVVRPPRPSRPRGRPRKHKIKIIKALMARILENIGAGASLTAVAALKCCKEWTVIGGRVLHKPDLIDLEDKKEKALMRAVSNFTGETMKKILTKRELENSTLTGTSSPFNVKPTVKEQLDPTVADGICDFIGKEFGLIDAKKYKPKIRSYIRAVLNNYSCKKEKNKGN